MPPLGAGADVVEGWIPFRRVFDVVAWGKRHVMMGATQVDRQGNQNISAIGDFDQPKRQLLGSRGAPGNTVNNRTSYWIPKHSPRTFVEQVDVVSGVGPRRAKEAGPAAARFNDIHRIVTNLGVLDLGGPDDTLRLLSVHPGVTVDEVREAVRLRPPRRWGRHRDPLARPRRAGRSSARCSTRRASATRRCRMLDQLLRTPLTELTGVRHPVVQTGMGWVSGPRLVTGTANAGGLGILASATMTHDELERAIVEVEAAHRPAVRGEPAGRRRGRTPNAATC